MKKLKYLLFLFIIFLVPSVFADTSYDMTSLITSPVNFPECGVGSYTGVELNGATNCWNTNTRYQGTLNRIYFNLPAPTGTTFETDTAYRLTLKMATDDWRNNFGTVVVSPGSSYTNNFVDTFTFVSMKQINITFTVPYSGSTSYQYLWVNLPAKSSSHLITGTSNWNLSNITLTKLTSGSGGGSTDPGGPSTSFDDTAIINNANENTQNVIDNNNQNTSDIIQNNNQNTQDIIDNATENFSNLNDNISANSISEINTQRYSITSQCTNAYEFDIFKGKRLTSSGTLVDDPNSFYVPQKIAIDTGVTSIFIKNPLNSVSNYLFLLFDASGNVLSVTNTASRSISVPSNAAFFQFSSTVANTFVFKNSFCILKSQQQTEDIINNQNQNAQQTQETITNNLNSCSSKTLSDDVLVSSGFLYQNGTIGSSSVTFYTDYIGVESNSSYVLNVGYTASTNSYCLYNSSKELISCYAYNNRNSISFNSGNASYIRYSGRKSLTTFSGRICSNRLDDVTNSITNSNVENGTGSDFFDDFTSQDFGLSQIISIPLNTIQSLTSKSCVPLQIPIPFTNSNVTLPCMTEIYENRFSTIYNLWKIVSFGIVAYLIAIDIFHIVKGFKDPESDKVEVLDL